MLDALLCPSMEELYRVAIPHAQIMIVGFAVAWAALIGFSIYIMFRTVDTDAEVQALQDSVDAKLAKLGSAAGTGDHTDKGAH